MGVSISDRMSIKQGSMGVQLQIGLSLLASIILRIIGYKFGKNNAGIIGCLQA